MKGIHVCLIGDLIFPQECELHPVLLKAHDLLPEMGRHAGRVLPLLNFTQQVEVMHIEGQKAGVFRMLLIRLVLGPGNHHRPTASFNLRKVALDRGADTILGEQRVPPAGIQKSFLPSQAEAQPVAVVDLITHVFHEQEKVAEIVGVLNGRPQIRLQHGTECGLAFGLPQPFHIADGLGGCA